METMQKIQRVSDKTTLTIGFIGRCVRVCVRQPKRVLIALIIIMALAVLAYVTLGNKTEEEHAQQELAAAIAAVGQLMILPEGDEPVLATITDATALTTQQAFFAGAIDGDQLLLFPRSLKAIIYSPSRDKIINAGPIEQSPTTNGATAEQSSAGNQSGTIGVGASPSNTTATNLFVDALTVEVRNGTDRAGYAAQFAEELGANDGYKVVKVDDAGRKDYQSTIVFVHTDDEDKQFKASVLATSLGVLLVKSLLDGEKATSADMLIILGEQ